MSTILVRGLLLIVSVVGIAYFLERKQQAVPSQPSNMQVSNPKDADKIRSKNPRTLWRASSISKFILLMLILSSASWLVWWLSRYFGFVSQSAHIARWASEVDQVAGAHTQVTGVLAGFTITLIVVFATLRLGNTEPKNFGPQEEATVGLLFVAFFGYVTGGILYSIVIERQDLQRYFFFSAASNLYYLSVILSFAALLTFMELMENAPLRSIARLAVGGALFGGFPAVAIPLIDLLLINWPFIVLILFLSMCIAPLVPHNSDYKYLMIRYLPMSIILISLTFMICMSGFFLEGFDNFFRISALGLTFATTTMCMYVSLSTYRLGR